MCRAWGVRCPGRDPAWPLAQEDDPLACAFADVHGYVGCVVIALRGELDISNAAEFSSWLAAAASPGAWAIVDLAELAYIDCSSLWVLAGARERARLAGGDVMLAGPRGAVARLLVLTGQAEVFSVFPSVGSAASSAGLAAFDAELAVPSAAEFLAAATDGDALTE